MPASVSSRLLLLTLLAKTSLLEASPCFYPADEIAGGLCCGAWCAENTDSWAKKCEWTTKCAGCADCSNVQPDPPSPDAASDDAASDLVALAATHVLPPPPTSPPMPPAPPPAPPDFSNSTEGQLIFGTGALVFMLLVGTVRSPAAPYPPPPPRRNLTRCALPLPSRCPHAALTPPSRCPHAALPPPSRYCPCPGGLPSPCPCQGGRSEDRRLGGRAQGPRRCGTLNRPLTRAQRRRAL